MNLETLAPYLLPLAMGLAGAALYHLIGPIWFLVRCALWPVWVTIGVLLSPIHFESPREWHRRLFPSKPYDAMWHGAKHVAEEDCPYIAYGSTRAIAGKPCPKPTKDLRPGDEVSIRARVTTVGENRIHLDAPKDTPNAYLHVAVDVDELNKIRIDNK